MPRAFVRQAEFEKAVEQTALALAPEVIKMIPELGNDWTGDPAVFFEVVLKDGLLRRETSGETTLGIMWKVSQVLAPMEEWGVLPYFSYISESEYVKSQQPIPA